MVFGLDTQGYTILRNVFEHEQEKKQINQVWGGGGFEELVRAVQWLYALFCPSGEDSWEAR